MSVVLLLGALCVLTVGGTLCLIVGGRSHRANLLGGAVSVAGAIPAVIAAGRSLCTGQASELRAPWPMPFGSFRLAIDGLSAFFVIAIAVVCGLAAVYGAAYMKSYAGRKNLGLSWFFYNILFAGMLVVVTAANGMLFLFAWEAMSLASFFLVMSEYEREEVRQAGWTYLVATHLGTSFLFALFLLLGRQAETLDFGGFVSSGGAAPAGALYLLALVGFGTKAGLMPMHVWLPAAHPAAPSHVSAVMSGVMIKTGIYGLLRVLTFLGEPQAWPSWWGWALVGIGAASGVGGVLFALAQRDLKRLLAYSSVENIGIIAMGLGVWLLGIRAGNHGVAAMGLLGALLHVWNHAIFKSLLFMGAGAVNHAAGTRDIERLGGLLKRMRQTGLACIVGSAAICGLPPLNGFVSELLIYLAAFSGLADSAGPSAAWLLAIVALATIGGLAVACFTKVIGIVFLGEGRSDSAAQAHEAPAMIRLPMLVLAVLCLFIGLLSPLAVGLLEPATTRLLPTAAALGCEPETAYLGWLWRVSAAAAALLAIAVVLAALRRLLFSNRTVVEAPTWDCGYAAPTARMQYTASSFAWPIIDMFRFLLRPRVRIEPPEGLFPERGRVESATDDVVLRYGYAPLFRSIEWLAARLRWVQEGRNQLYVLYIASTLLILLFWKLGIAR